jgi:hypothetical protein
MKPGRFLTAAMIVFALVVVPSAAYVGGYYGLAVETDVSYSAGRGDPNRIRFVDRFYRYGWQVEIFKPASRAEQWLTGSVVDIYCLDDLVPDIAEP